MRLFFNFFANHFYYIFEFEFTQVVARAVGQGSAHALGYTFAPRSSHVKFQQKFRRLSRRFSSQIHI